MNKTMIPANRVTGPVLITGAAGALGVHLARVYRHRAIPIRRLSLDGVTGEDAYPGSVCDPALVARAAAGAKAIVHLGGISVPGSPWRDYLDVNIDGTRVVLEAARKAGVERVVLASSNHAAGYTRRARDSLPADTPPRPDSLYGVSKVAVEALGSYYANQFGLKTTSLRIGSCTPEPTAARALATWLSYPDFVRLVDAAIAGPWPGHTVVWGISRNSRRWWSLEEGERIGYSPHDDSEPFAGRFDRETDVPFVGGDAPKGVVA